ncbi:Uncharacterised protein [Aeromonas hydrophila]|nr:Uncharacterised protein [Aeromonas hydrophila]
MSRLAATGLGFMGVVSPYFFNQSEFPAAGG